MSRQLGRLAGRMMRAAKPVVDSAKSSEFARTLKDAYHDGKADAERPTDDEAPAAAATPDEASARADDAAAGDAAGDAADEAAVADLMRGIDWAAVRAATAERTTEVAAAMKSLAADVDWGRVQAGAARVSSALIAAVAAGQIPVGGRLAGPVTRAILNDRNLAQRVNTSLQRTDPSGAPDFRASIEATAREV